MHSFLRTFAATLPLVAAAPYDMSPRDSNPGCAATSFSDFSWTVESFTYHASYVFSTPAHQIASGSVDFNLTNPALEGNVICSAYSTQLTDFFYGNFNYNCAVPENSSAETSFAFSRPSGLLTVNQTWTCSDQDPQYPITFTGYGAVNLTLNCTDDFYQNPDWQPGEIYSDRTIDCTPVTLPLKPYDKTAIA
ncbi:hypothetical protein F5Y19DRAFT_449707 [Xylariaceae sp. FL1651]|nr:hypothetical protein F5Y19DRAFT_449707 [Xylariaceae sp. FL1651]